jgi:hypothetical protein
MHGPCTHPCGICVHWVGWQQQQPTLSTCHAPMRPRKRQVTVFGRAHTTLRAEHICVCVVARGLGPQCTSRQQNPLSFFRRASREEVEEQAAERMEVIEGMLQHLVRVERMARRTARSMERPLAEGVTTRPRNLRRDLQPEQTKGSLGLGGACAAPRGPRLGRLAEWEAATDGSAGAGWIAGRRQDLRPHFYKTIVE